VLGIAMTGLLAAFMAGMAANVSSFNTVVTYDIIEPYLARGRPDEFYLRMGRIVTCVGVLVAIGTAFIASGYQNIMDYIQLLFSFFNAPLFATFIIALFWKRATPWAASPAWPRVRSAPPSRTTRTSGAGSTSAPTRRPPSGARPWRHRRCGGHRRGVARDAAEAREQLVGLVWSETPKRMRSPKRERGEGGWYRSPTVLGFGVLISCAVLNVVFG
jgi:SSS family solute:Na+ symporter